MNTLKPHVRVYKAGGTIVHGHAVKVGADAEHVIEGTANTDKCLGIAQVAVQLSGANSGLRQVSSGEFVEVATPGGGAEVKISETMLAGQHGVCHTDGTVVLPNALGDGLIVALMEGGVSGDLVDAIIIKGQAAAAE